MSALQQGLRDSHFQPRWALYPEVRQIIGAFQVKGVPFCFLGGAVRDALARREPRDYDLLVAAPTPMITHILKEAKLPAYITNQTLGTVRTVVGKKMFDLSPLLPTPGNPSPAFSVRVREYVRKSDFTMNSLYWMPSGHLFDPYGGMEDLQAGRVRFITDAKQSLEDNYIRVLRFFRFHADYGKGDPDPQGVEFCMQYAHRIPDSHPIRIQQQMFKLLLARHAYPTIKAMQQHGILERAFGMTITECDTLAEWEKIETLLNKPPMARLRLLTLLLHASLPADEALTHIVAAWQLPEEMHKHLQSLLEVLPKKKKITALHPERQRTVLMLRWAMEGMEAGRATYEPKIAALKE